MNYGNNVRLEGCSIAGNGAAASNTYDGVYVAAAISNFTITDNIIAPAGAASSNTQRYAINIATGASNNYIIANNFTTGNTTPYINDNGTGAQKYIYCNTPGPVKSVLTAAVTTSGTGGTETLMFNCAVPANAVKAGDTFRIRLYGDTSVASPTLIFKIRTGTAGTVAGDTTVLWTSTTSAAQTQYYRAGIDLQLVVRTIGSSGTVYCDGLGYAYQTLLPPAASVPATVTVNTTALWYIDVTCTCSTASGFIGQVGEIDWVSG